MEMGIGKPHNLAFTTGKYNLVGWSKLSYFETITGWGSEPV
jgi:hypothetical protein